MRRFRIPTSVLTAVATLAGVVAVVATVTTVAGADHNDCALRYVAGGDEVVAGKDAESGGNHSDTAVYSRKLLEDDDKLHDTGPWCEYNTAPNEVTRTEDYVQKVVYEGTSQQSAAWERDARLVTLTIGRQNGTIVDHVDRCFEQVKDHDFYEANACALLVLANPLHWELLEEELTHILSTFRLQQNGNPQLVVAVTGYPNPYPEAWRAAAQIPGFCAQLMDTVPTCMARWLALPPVLVTLDQVVKKLNTTIEETVAQFTRTSQGRFVFVNPYEKFRDHCMEMKVTIKTQVYHPTNDVHQHDTQETNFGCNDTWIGTDGTDGNKVPFFYLTPAITGLLVTATQTTKNMGVNPNEKGHECTADLIWEAVKLKLDVAQAPDENVCTGS